MKLIGSQNLLDLLPKANGVSLNKKPVLNKKPPFPSESNHAQQACMKSLAHNSQGAMHSLETLR